MEIDGGVWLELPALDKPRHVQAVWWYRADEEEDQPRRVDVMERLGNLILVPRWPVNWNAARPLLEFRERLHFGAMFDPPPRRRKN